MSIRPMLEKKFFPFVIKPGRYAGGELGQITKEPAGRTSYLHIYPDKYEIGQSHVGLQIIYNIVNRDDRFICERAFAVDDDAEAVMRKEKIELFSLESSRIATDFDLVGFSLVDETVYTNMLNCIDLANIPVRAKERTEKHPLVIAGGPAVFNPEPIAPFIDLFLLGDAEEALPEILAVLHEHKDASREAKLEAIVRAVSSVYVPAFYDDNRQPLHEFAPFPIPARMIDQLKPEYYPKQPLVPLIDTVQSHLAVEIMRGCPQGCRFCMARAVYQPTRVRPQAEIVDQIETQLATTGYNEVTLLSLSSADYPKIEKLAAPLAKKLEARRISITLPSLRPGSISPELLNAVKRVRRFGITIAPEAGTERLRTFLRKNISDEAILDTVRLAYEKGWTTIKMYFMVGLPSETHDDIQGIVDICRKVYLLGKQFDGRKTINVTLSPFVPKPHTPFQWDEALPEAQVFERIKWIRNQIKPNQISFKHNSSRLAQLVAVISRGNRQMADAIEDAFNKGARFDGWSESFNWESWLESFTKANINCEKMLKAIPFSADLPWSHISKGRSVEMLREERERTSFKLREFIPKERTAEATPEGEAPALEFGRSRKKIASRNQIAPTKNKIRFRWGKTERCKYLSHLDNLRMIEMSLMRAKLPVEYSQGFNPSPKLSFGPPLSLGMTSEAEYVDITFTENLRPEMVDQLKAAITDGFYIIEAKTLFGKPGSLSSRVNRSHYQLSLDHFKNPDSLPEAIEKILSETSLEVERTNKRGTKVIDIRPAIFDLSIDKGQLNMVLGIGEGIFGRPSEVATLLKDHLACDIKAVAFHRYKVYRQEDFGQIIDGLEL